MKKIALPLENKKVCAHFGRCQEFVIYEVEDNQIVTEDYKTPPGHQPGAFPRWMKDLGVDTVISGGMGRKAQALFNDFGIDICLGTSNIDPKKAAKDYLAGSLTNAGNLCDH